MCNDGEEREEQMRNHLVANKKTINLPANNDGRIEKFGKGGEFPKRERHPLGECGRITFYSNTAKKDQCGILDDLLSLDETLGSEDACKWEAARQEE